MKKKKFLVAVLLTMLFTLSTVLSSFAAPSPSANPTKPVAAVDKDGNDVSANVTINTVSEGEIPEGSDDVIGGNDNALNAVNVDIEDGVTTTVTVDAPGVKAGDSVYVLVYDESSKGYKKVGAVAGDNVVSFTLEKDAVVIIVKGNAYELTGPATWTKGSNAEFMFKSEAEFEKFTEVKVDGQVVDAANYEAKKGSTEIYFKAAYLDSLAVGAHSVEGVWTDGTASATFNVVEAGSSEPTGDKAPVTALSIIAVLSMLVACGLILKSKKAN